MYIYICVCVCARVHAYVHVLHVCNIQRYGWRPSSRPTLGAEFNASWDSGAKLKVRGSGYLRPVCGIQK